MDPASIVEDTEWKRLCPQMDRQTDERMEKVKQVYPIFNFVYLYGGISVCLGFNPGFGSWMKNCVH